MDAPHDNNHQSVQRMCFQWKTTSNNNNGQSDWKWKMMRFVYFCSVIGALAASSSVFALPSIISDSDPAPGRSPGPPADVASDRFYASPSSFPPTTRRITKVNSALADIVDEQNYSSTDHNRRPSRHRHRRRHHHQISIGSAEWADGHGNHHHWEPLPSHRINKLGARTVDKTNSSVNESQMNLSSIEITARNESIDEQGSRRQRSERATERQLTYHARWPGDGGGNGDNNEHDDDEDDDWHYVNLYCGDSVEERGNLKASFLNQLNDVVITLPPQDNHLISAEEEMPGKENEQSTQPKQKLNVAANVTGDAASKRNKGASSPYFVGKQQQQHHRFQKVTAGDLAESKQREPWPAATMGQQEQQVMNRWRLKPPQSSLTAAGAAAINAAKDNGQTSNKLPLQFDVTHELFEPTGGLVADLEYSGELYCRRKESSAF